MKSKSIRFQKVLDIELLDKKRETKKNRRLNQTKTSYASKGIQIFKKRNSSQFKTKKTGQKTRTTELKIKLKTKSERKLKRAF